MSSKATSAEKPLNVRLPLELATKLDALTLATGRTKSAITVEALRGYVEAEAWQIQDIQAAMEEARQGDFASEAELNALMARYGA